MCFLLCYSVIFKFRRKKDVGNLLGPSNTTNILPHSCPFMQVYVKWTIDEDALKEVFPTAKAVISYSQPAKPYAFICFDSQEEADRAIAVGFNDHVGPYQY